MELEEWGFVLPEMPRHKEHYWGISGFDFRRSATELIALSDDELKKIARTGSQWCLQHYSPKATAKRFLAYLSALDTDKTVLSKMKIGVATHE